MINVILCGGAGTRLWPLSRQYFPKQFCQLVDSETLYQKTLKRNHTLCDEVLIVANQDQYFIALDQAQGICENTKVLLEPVGRNTAPAIALAALSVKEDDVLLVTPSDHLIKNTDEYAKCLKRAKELAEQDHLVTFGITPNYPETGYGYIEADGEDVLSFKEKPDHSLAMKYISLNNYYWNSGIFCFKAKVFLQELKKYSNEIYEKSVIAYNNAQKEQFIRIKKDDMEAIPSDSIDYAVMERSENVKVVPSDIEWSDLGSYDAVSKASSKNHSNLIEIDSSNNYVHTNEKKIVAMVDTKDLMIIDTDDALLVCQKGSGQKVKQALEEAKKMRAEVTELHTTAYRPWGSYTILADKEDFKAKSIKVNPGQKLSLQRHQKRAEHWTIISGEARVTLDEKTYDLKRNDYIHIPRTGVHRIENIGTTVMEFAEIQIGDYFGEDDIERLQDDYNRC